jgi:predicted acyl esterase
MMGQQYIRGPVDQLRTEMRDDVLVFSAPPLRDALTVIGRVRLAAWVSSETPDTDVVARLCDVHPDGRSYNVVDGILRLRFREGLERPVPCSPGQVYRVHSARFPGGAPASAAGLRQRLPAIRSLPGLRPDFGRRHPDLASAQPPVPRP